MNATFRQLRLFLALADSGSVTGAARIMHVTQPTASMQLRELADSVGLPLFEVVARRVHLTDAGLELARVARAMADEWDAFREQYPGLEVGTTPKTLEELRAKAQTFDIWKVPEMGQYGQGLTMRWMRIGRAEGRRRVFREPGEGGVALGLRAGQHARREAEDVVQTRRGIRHGFCRAFPGCLS